MTVCIVVNGETTRHDLDLDLTMPNVKLVQAIFILTVLQYVQVLSGLNHYFMSYCVHRQTDRHTGGHEYSIVSVYKPDRRPPVFASYK